MVWVAGKDVSPAHSSAPISFGPAPITSWRQLRLLADRSDDGNQDAGADKTSDQIAEPATKRDTQQAENQAGHDGADYAKAAASVGSKPS